jgi:hypothetical protein
MTESSPSRAARVSRLTRLALAAPIAVTAAFAVAATAQATTDPTVIPGARYCGFDVTQTILTDNTKTISNPSGDRTTGHFVVQFAANGKSQTFNVSGASEAPTVSGTTATQVFTGPSYFIIGPGGRANTGAPAISYSPGRTVVQSDTNTHVVTSFSPTAPVTNICALLSP